MAAQHLALGPKTEFFKRCLKIIRKDEDLLAVWNKVFVCVCQLRNLAQMFGTLDHPTSEQITSFLLALPVCTGAVCLCFIIAHQPVLADKFESPAPLPSDQKAQAPLPVRPAAVKPAPDKIAAIRADVELTNKRNARLRCLLDFCAVVVVDQLGNVVQIADSVAKITSPVSACTVRLRISAACRVTSSTLGQAKWLPSASSDLITPN